MSYQSLYRRYRPRRFDEVRGQQHVVTALRNAVAEDRVGHAYLFSGPRGTGKTTSARILAKSLNCLERPDDQGDPCAECESCLSIDNGSSLDVVELDAASNRGVGEMHSLISSVAIASPGKNKLYILDEVHMLTPQASNSLLKTLEEPPAGVVFVLATTDPHKVLPTIRSRTQHFEFRLLGPEELEQHVRYVAKDADLDVEDDGILAAVNRGKGSARDALSALEQIAAAGGVLDNRAEVGELITAMGERDGARVLAGVAALVQSGREPRDIADATIVELRNVFLAGVAPDLSQAPPSEVPALSDQFGRIGEAALLRSIEVLGTAVVEMRQAPDPRVVLEAALVRIAQPDADISPASLLQRIETLERKLAGVDVSAGSAGSGPSTAASTAAQAASEPAPAPPPPPRKRAAPPAESPSPQAEASTSKDTAPPPPTRKKPPPEAAPAAAAPSNDSTSSDSTPPPSRKKRAPAPAAEAPAEAPPAAQPAPVAAASSATGGGDLPYVDELAKQWEGNILGLLKPRARSYIAAGRFVSVAGATATYSLPNASHRDACKQVLPDVESVLTSHFGFPVTMTLVSEEDLDTVTDAAPPPNDLPDDIDPVEVATMDDAPDAGSTDVERITDAFPGTTVVDKDA